MKFDPFSWREVPNNEETPFGKGRLRLRLSGRAPLYVSAQGVEALVGIEENFEVEVSEDVTFRVDGPDGLRAFLYDPEPTTTEPEGEVFTNADRMPMESGSLAEVTRALRVFEMERRTALREIRQETAKLKAARARSALSDEIAPVVVEAADEEPGEAEVSEEREAEA